MDNTNTAVHAEQKMTPKFFFISLGVLVALIATVTSLLNLIFATLEKHFPDALNGVYQYGYNTYSFEGMRTALATLIIIFPLFLVLSRAWTKLVESGLGRVDAIIKKWMLYLVIFLSSVVVAVDLVTLVRYFVSGEITTRFILKVLAVLVVALLAGYHYFKEIESEKMKKGLRLISASIACVIVLVSIVTSFAVMGSPFTQRKLRLDERRMQDLQSIQYQVINFWQQKEKLPETLAELSNPISSYSVPVDPEFEKGVVYEYKKTGNLTFELCATFALPIPKGWQEYSKGGGGIMPIPATDYSTTEPAYPYGGGANESWSHEAGRTCFTRTIDKDIYPPYKKMQ